MLLLFTIVYTYLPDSNSAGDSTGESEQQEVHDPQGTSALGTSDGVE